MSEKYSQLVEYEKGPVEFQASLVSASALKTSCGTEAGRRMADFNVTRVARTHARSSDVGIVAVEYYSYLMMLHIKLSNENK